MRWNVGIENAFINVNQARYNLPYYSNSGYGVKGFTNENGGIKAKNEFIHTTSWDLVIFDEYHYGAWREKATNLFEKPDEEKESDFDYEEEFINLTLNTFISDLTPELQRHLNKISREISNDELNDFQSIIDLYLFDYNTINKTRTIVNGIFSEVNIQTVVSYLFNKANIKNVLASPSSNTNIYNQLIIPPTDSIIDALENVQNMYGIFDTTPTLFF